MNFYNLDDEERMLIVLELKCLEPQKKIDYLFFCMMNIHFVSMEECEVSTLFVFLPPKTLG